MIENARITKVSLSMADHGCLTFGICVTGGGWGCNIGGWAIGHGYCGADYFDSTGAGLVAMMKIMDVVGVERWEDLQGKYIRIDSDGWGSTIHKIGNILKDDWFDIREFFENAKPNDKGIVVLDERPPKEEEEDWDDEDGEQVPTSGVNSIPR